MSFNALKYYVCLNYVTVMDYDALQSRGLPLLSNICLLRANWRQITLLKGYIHTNEQPVVFIP